MSRSDESSQADLDRTESRRIPRRFRRLYVIALGTVAVLAISGQVLVQHALVSQRDGGRIVNQAGAQRMLSQRLSLKLLLLETAPLSERADRVRELTGLSQQWLRSHEELVEAAQALSRDASARESLVGLFGKLEVPMMRIVAVVDEIVSGADLSPAQRDAVLQDQEIFLPLMDTAVRELELSGTARVRGLQQLELALLVVTLVVLMIEAFLVFRPAVKRLQRSLSELELQRARTADQLQSLRHLTGGIAHHFNNILTAILGNAELIQIENRHNAILRDYAETQIQQSKRASEMIAQLQLYAGKRNPDLTPVALGPWLSEVVSSLSTADHRHRFEVVIFEDAVAKVDRQMLHRALDGLVANAVEAMERPGTVRIELSQHIVEEPRTMAGPYRFRISSGLYARLRVIDEGVGIPHDLVDRIFDPYYSAKTFGRGLGLASILGIAHAHEGGIEVDSEPGEGTTISLFLPLSSELPVRDARVAPALSPRSHSA